VFAGPVHPYTEALLSAVPSVDGEAEHRIKLDGDIPSPADPPSGCTFHTRCQYAMPGTCDVTFPESVTVAAGHQIACHLPVDQLPTPVRIGDPQP
jgi:peptide/nickel transport system ATP-binding protein